MENRHPPANGIGAGDPHQILAMLQGGDRRSIGRSNEVVAIVLAQPELFDVLMQGMLLDDPLLRMRCADAAEKVSVVHPEYLQPYRQVILDELSKVEQQEVRWHVAAMLPRLELDRDETRKAVALLLGWTNERSSIVRTLAMQALADIALRDRKWLPEVRRHLGELTITGTLAMQARGRKLLAAFDKKRNGK